MEGKPHRLRHHRQLRLVRQSRRRMGRVLAECRDMMKFLSEHGDDYSVLTGMARIGQKWALFLHLLVLHDHCFLESDNHGFEYDDAFYLIGRILVMAEAMEKTESLTVLANRGRNAAKITADMCRFCRRPPRIKTYHLTTLNNSMRFWTGLRSAWRVEEHNYPWNEWPLPMAYLESCPHDVTGRADAQPLGQLPLGRMAAIAAARLHHGYVQMLHRFLGDPCYQATGWRMQLQSRFDANEYTVDAVLKQGARNDTVKLRSSAGEENPTPTRKGLAAII